MAAALARLAQNTGEERFAAGVEKAIAYERLVYVQERGNWPDFRSNTEPTNFMHTWCHGAPGILISRLVLQAAGWNDMETSRDLQMATASTAAALERAELTPGGAAHLCCGDLGLTSLLRLAGYHTSLALRVEASLIQQASQSGQYPLLAVDAGTLNLPGLFTGHAGVALALLEAADGLQWLPTVLSAGLLEVAPTMQFK
jgi:lantibiotic modifying enzyme